MPKRTRTTEIEREREVQKAVRRLKGRLLAFSRKSLGDVFEMGDLLNEAAALLRGAFGTWVLRECGIEPRTAFNYRRLSTRLGSRRYELVALSISPTAAVHLGGASDEVLEHALERARAGLPVSVEFIRELVRRERSKDGERTGLELALDEFRRDVRAQSTRLAHEFISDLEALLCASRNPATAALEAAAKRTLLETLEVLVGNEAAGRSSLAALLRRSAAQPDEAAACADVGKPSVLEICAGAGGAALGFEAAGYEHVALVDQAHACCETLRSNRPSWPVIQARVEDLDVSSLPPFDVLSGGVPCQPFSVQGTRGGRDDPRDLFPEVLRIAREARPRAVVIENVLGLSETVHDGYRRWVTGKLEKLGYVPFWNELDAQDFGVPQRRRRLLLVAFRDKAAAAAFRWPKGTAARTTLGGALHTLMAANGWRGASKWSAAADGFAPTLIGAGRKLGIDLGSQTGRDAFRKLGVDPGYVARSAPEPDFVGSPRLTLPMLARVQDFPDDWRFSGSRRDAFQQVVNAFPRSAAQAVAEAVKAALTSDRSGLADPLRGAAWDSGPRRFPGL